MYGHARNQKIHNQSALVNYTAGYICFRKTPRSIDNSDNTWAEQYIDNDQINRKLVKKLRYDKFELDKNGESHQSAVIYYTKSEVLNQFFFAAMNKQKNGYNRLFYTK